MRIGGWSRVGIVLSVLYGALVIFVAYDGRPNLESKYSTWFDEAADAIAEVLTKTENQEILPYQVREALLKNTDSGNVAWLEKVATSPSENQKKFSAQVARLNEKHRAIISGLFNEQERYWLLAMAWWIGGTMLLFSTGWTIHWIYRGFRQPSA